jgi:DNA-binding LytR/AlgR family response regulator
MKCTVIVDPNCEEEIVIRVRERNKLAERIEELVKESSPELIGYGEGKMVILKPEDICCCTVENGRVLARTQTDTLLLKQRLYMLEELLGSRFVRINQSCLVNTAQIRRFDASFAGALTVTLKNGYRDYVSRRQLKKVKERMGL